MGAREEIQTKRFLAELAAADIAQAQIAQPMNGGGGYRLGTITRTIAVTRPRCLVTRPSMVLAT